MALNNQQKYLVVIGNEAQAMEDTLQQIYSGYWIDEAVGEQLDVLGRVVGQERGGMVDADFRRLIRARISVNRSKGTVKDVITVAKLVVDDETVYYKVDQVGSAGFALYLLDQPVSNDVAALTLKMLQDTKAGGVRIILEWTPEPIADSLIWDEGNWDDDKWYHDEDA